MKNLHRLHKLHAWHKLPTLHKLHALRFKSLKWRHGVLIALLILVTLTKMIPLWGFIYTYRVYPVIGTLLSPISGFFPFAVGDVFIALSIAWVILYPIYEIGLRKKLAQRFIFLKPRNSQSIRNGCYPKKKAVFWRVAEYLLWVYAWFYIAWGLNYSQPNIYYRIGMKPVEVSKSKFKKFAYQYADSLNTLSIASLSNASLSISGKSISSDSIVDDGLKNRVRDAVLKEYNKIGYREGINMPFNQHPHAKTMVFTPLSSMAGVTGSMGPFFCEFTLNGDILAHDYPATYAHEFDYPAGKKRPPLLAQQAMQGIGCRPGCNLRTLSQGQPCGRRQKELLGRYRSDSGLARKEEIKFLATYQKNHIKQEPHKTRTT